jgi:hypothetical protein
MYCPECSGEYREGFTHCADCDVDLVASLPASLEGTPAAELVTVLETSDPGELAFMESLLRGAGIPFSTKGDHLQSLFALGAIGGYNAVAGPVSIQVSEEHAEAAAQILEEAMPDESEDPDLDAAPE